MKIRLFDKFDYNFTSVIWDGVDVVIGNTVYFEDGTEETFDPEFVDWKEVYV